VAGHLVDLGDGRGQNCDEVVGGVGIVHLYVLSRSSAPVSVQDIWHYSGRLRAAFLLVGYSADCSLVRDYLD